MNVCMSVRIGNRRNQERERAMGGWWMGRGRALLIPSVSSLSLTHTLSYVIHMIHVEPRGADITLTFCVQHTHTHTLPTNTKEMCPQIPNPRALCTVFLCACVCANLSFWPSVIFHGR